ncbi:hypothetical protein [Nocardia anaemiae]|uniref:hypothetical protein n=1 Tax=Nocardia anaemiae TaxID=263910 RepID=UPI000A99D157|nr:hypothetical protein [Nocardia anaemiae]
MSYPQYQPYPSVPAPAPSGGTAITAGVLASVGSAGQLLGGGLNIVLGATDLARDLAEYDSTGLFVHSWFKTYLLVTGSIAVVSAFLLGVGAVMMFTRRPLGRVLVVAGCAVVVVAGIAGYAVTARYTTSGASAAEIGGLFGLIFPIATAVLTLVPPTRRWLDYRPVAAPSVGAYPYGPAGYPAGPGVPSAGYPSGSAMPPAGYPSGPGVPPAGYPFGPGVSSAGYPSGPGVPPAGYPPGAGVPSAESPSVPTPYSPYPQSGPSPDVPGAQSHPQAGSDQSAAQPQSGANPQAAPDSPPPDLTKRQSDPTIKTEDSPWRRPPSQ